MNHRWTAADVARATGVTAALIGHWCDRHTITLGADDEQASGHGVPRKFSINRVLQIALAKILSDLGMATSKAARLALTFTDTGTVDRSPGELFEDAPTVLLVSGDRSRVVRSNEISSADDVQALMAHDSENPAAVIVLPLNRIVARVRAALGLELPAACRL